LVAVVLYIQIDQQAHEWAMGAVEQELLEEMTLTMFFMGMAATVLLGTAVVLT
jgi:hypothetical protein